MLRQLFIRNISKAKQYFSNNQGEIEECATIGSVMGGTIGGAVGLLSRLDDGQTHAGNVSQKMTQITSGILFGGTVGAAIGATCVSPKVLPWGILATYGFFKVCHNVEKNRKNRVVMPARF